MFRRSARLCRGKIVGAVAILAGVGQLAFAQSSAHSAVTASVGSSEVAGAVSVCNTPSDGLMTKAQGAAILEELARIETMLAARNSVDATASAAPVTAGPARLKITADWHALGREDAPVVVVEFTDLQCPVCQRFHATTFARLKADYIDTGKIRFVSRDLPLAMHQYAHDAAVAERCAGAQGKFWEFRDAVLSANEKPASDELASAGQKVGLDMNVFAQCQRQNSFSSVIDSDEDDAQAAGIHGTPSFVIGRAENGWLQGTKLLGNKPYAAFQSAIEAAMQAPTNVSSQGKPGEAGEASKR